MALNLIQKSNLFGKPLTLWRQRNNNQRSFMELSNHVAIVTGGASGLGRASIELFSKAGASVAIFDMNEEAGQALASELGDKAIFCAVNIADEDSIIAAIEKVMDAFGAIHICINCAGRGGGATKTLSKKGPFPMDLFRDVININLVGTFNVITLVAEKMAMNEPNDKGERGVIINTSSIAAYEGQRGQVAYAASKGALVSLTLPVARDLAYYGIRMTTIAPGLCETPLLGALPAEVKEGLAKDVQFPKRLAEAEEFASLTEHIISNPYINGETIRLDGGLRMPAG
jgi:NAD(P)-dependent dehydrogenase (short-subunit alcohol dehydrogenase family)